LTPQGRFLNDMFVVEDAAGSFLMETERERAPGLAKKLKMYTLRSKVTVEDRSGAMEVAVMFGPGADKKLPIPGATAFVDPRLPELGVRVLAPAGQATALLGLPEAPLADYETLRLKLGVPDGSRDLPV
jgi:folate-binding Fe-S cluster repair protein YgfZ